MSNISSSLLRRRLPTLPDSSTPESGVEELRRTPFSLRRVLTGVLLSSGVALLAYQRRSLSKSGIFGTVVVGTTSFGLGGLSWGLALIYFFVSSSLFSHFRQREKEQTAADKFSKGGQRDIGQVVANGGVASALAIAYATATSEKQRRIYQAGYIGALATANADTWATEIGVLSKEKPRSILTGKSIERGTSGGITLLGTGAAEAGAFSLGTVYSVIQRGNAKNTALLAGASGLVGSLFDSFLGATLQAMYYCPHCKKETERRVHNCGTHTYRVRGLSLMSNDVVNFLATSVGALVAMVMQKRIHD